MGDNQITDTTTLKPKRTERLGDIQISPEETKPLGGLNPYNPYFDKIGQQFHQLLITNAGLQKHHRLLDIGCGTGRLAKPLIKSLSNNYYGFDINKQFIDYCQSTYNNKNFICADVQHDEYNSTGSIDANKYEFPYDNQSFDIVILIAVLNHFKFEWVTQYFNQIARVLRPSGKLFATILTLNQTNTLAINRNKKPPFQFIYRTPLSWHDFETRPLFNVAYPEPAIRRICISNGLMIVEPIRYGEWCGSDAALTGHDILIATK